MRYAPSPIPIDGTNGPLRAWLARELRSLSNAFAAVDNLTLPVLGAEPEKVSNGMIVYADGASWNPGSGAGFYGREAGAWVKL